MNQYRPLFKKYFPKKKKIKKVINPKYCYECNMMKRLDTINAYFVCINCGVVSLEKCIQTITFNDRKSYKHYTPIINYSRYNQFKKYVFNLRYLDYKLKRRLNNMFLEVDTAFNELYISRTNFIRYKYIIVKLLQLLEYDHLCDPKFYPKSKIVTYRYDMIWKQICKKLEWKFISSVCLLCIIDEKINKRKKKKKKKKRYVNIY